MSTLRFGPDESIEVSSSREMSFRATATCWVSTSVDMTAGCSGSTLGPARNIVALDDERARADDERAARIQAETRAADAEARACELEEELRRLRGE